MAKLKKPSLWLLLQWLVAMTTAGCFLEPGVVRVVDGQQVKGRYVQPDAYALFMDGVLAEQRGNLAAAEQLYIASYRRDRRGVAILVRLGAVRCAMGSAGYGSAQQTFDEALGIDETFVPAYLERARCAMRRGAHREALVDTQSALAIEPFDVDVTAAMADALEANGQVERAAQVLDGLMRVRPSDRVRRAVRAFAQRQADCAGACRAQEDAGRVLDQLDELLVSSQLGEARAFATQSGLDHGYVAVRACALGLWRLARRQARIVLAAEPGHPDALAAWLSSPSPLRAYRTVDPLIWKRLFRHGESERKLSPLGALVMADAIERRFGRELAVAWWQKAGAPAPKHDSLAHSLWERLAPASER